MSVFLDNLINKRFRAVYEALEDKKLIKGKSDIATQLGTYNHVINSILKGKRNITVDQLNKLFDIYSVNANFLFGSSDQMFTTEGLPTSSLSDMRFGAKNNIKLIHQEALAGVGIPAESILEETKRFSIPSLEGDLYAVRISGDSMLPTITNGDIVVCESVERGVPLKDNAVYVIVTDIVVAKRIQQIKELNITVALHLISDNSEVYTPYQVNLDEVRQILKVKRRLTSHRLD